MHSVSVSVFYTASCTIILDAHAHTKLFSLSPCALKRCFTRSTALELFKLISGSGASIEELVWCGLSCERRAVVSAGSG